jgi:hypothetical protein
MPRSSLGMTVWGSGGKLGIFSTGELNSLGLMPAGAEI